MLKKVAKSFWSTKVFLLIKKFEKKTKANNHFFHKDKIWFLSKEFAFMISEKKF